MGTSPRRALALTRWELASGLAIGGDPSAGEVQPADGRTERGALEVALLPALERQPCVVSFSGGRDSSVVLALAVRAARKRGLPDPIPVTLRFPGVQSTQESEWQELVVSHLALSDWHRLELSDELDHLGAIAQAGLVANGLLWPPNAHFHVPIFAQAAGGAVLTGLDGDGLFRGWRWQRARIALSGRARAEPRDALRILLAAAPPPVRAAAIVGRLRTHVSWLRPAANRQLRETLALDAGREPNRWDARVGWYAGRRYLQLGVHSLGLLAEPHHVRVIHPFLDAGFLSTLAARGGRAGYGTRSQAMSTLFGDLLPSAVLQRRTKGEFGAALWSERARRFAADWDGQGLDLELLDPEALAHAWRATNPPLAAATLLQAAWLATQRNA
jgi:hypothetical protein